MFEFLNPSNRHDAGPLTNVAAADHFWRLLPRNDPFESQLTVSEALADLAGSKNHNRDELRALIAVDQRSRRLGEALLINYASAGTQSQSLEKRSWQAAFELSQSFGHAYVQVMQHLLGDAPSRGCKEYLPVVALRLFQHRQVEILLRPFVTERTVADGWSDLHTAYQHAESAGLLAQTVTPQRWHEEQSEKSTLEREYINILLLELINGGQFSPYDVFWLNRRIPRWCSVLSLQSKQSTTGAVDRADERFVVDLGSAQGLMRLSRSAPGVLRYLDPAPMLALISEEIVALRDRDRPAEGPASFGRGRQLKLLRKLHTICMPKPAQVNRRGERKPVASTVKAIVGLSHIMRMVRNEERKKSIVAPPFMPEVPEVEEITITVFGGFTESSPASMRHHGGRSSPGGEDEFGVPHQVWQLKDRSDSGCGLRGQIRDSNRVLPGALVAFRERDDMPWTVGVVRRLQKRIGDRVDIGVEFVGQNPVGVSMTDDDEPDSPANAPPDQKRRRCAALYLPESTKRPAMPFRTLILSPREFAVGRCLRLRSDDANYTVRLKEPIEEQDDFIWLPFEVVDRRAKDPSGKDRSTIGIPTIGPRLNLPSPAAGPAAPSEPPMRQPTKRASGALKI